MFFVNRNSMHGCEMRKTYRGLETSPTNIFFLCGSDFPVAMKYNESPFCLISKFDIEKVTDKRKRGLLQDRKDK